MNKWLLRGLVFAAGMVVLRLLQGAAINQWETHTVLISVILLTSYAAVVVLWGYFDGRGDAEANPDPDRRSDFAMIWLLAGLVAGILGGFVSWLISLFYTALYVEGLINEVTTFAAFTALLVFIPAIIGVALGRRVVDRKAPAFVRKSSADNHRADTDVFEAVRTDDTQEYPQDPKPVSVGATEATLPVDPEQTTPTTAPDRDDQR